MSAWIRGPNAHFSAKVLYMLISVQSLPKNKWVAVGGSGCCKYAVSTCRFSTPRICKGLYPPRSCSCEGDRSFNISSLKLLGWLIDWLGNSQFLCSMNLETVISDRLRSRLMESSLLYQTQHFDLFPAHLFFANISLIPQARGRRQNNAVCSSWRRQGPQVDQIVGSAVHWVSISAWPLRTCQPLQ